MYVENHCSPNNRDKQGSCLSKYLLKKIAKILNKHLKSRIKLKDKPIKLQENIHKIIKKHNNCSVEACWLTYDILKKKLSADDFASFENSFKPLFPDDWYSDPNKWLNTNDINKVLNQYEKYYKNFKYTGASPIDFHLKNKDGSCYVNELCNINLNDIIKEKKDCVGMVFNTDPHDESGQHWFSMFVDIKGRNRENPTIYHYDSVSTKPSQYIINLVNDIKKQGELVGISFDFLFNDIRHQFKNTECGVYSIHFLISMLKGSGFEKYINMKLNDTDMEKFRKEFYISLK